MVQIRPAPPPGRLLQALGLPAGAKTLASAKIRLARDTTAKEAEDNGWLVVTSRGLGIGLEDGPIRLRHTDWLEIERISLKRVEGQPRKGAAAWLTVHLIDQSPARRILLPNAAKRIASLINERFEASIVTLEHRQVAGHQVRGALRRTHDDRLEVQVVVPPQLDRHTLEVLAAIEQLGACLSEAAGGPPGTW
ncbi:MAG: hypothetical protein FWG16_01730 [Micrococcales bacterium]|nr:hypothetical protein [Micrococcales bacterium]